MGDCWARDCYRTGNLTLGKHRSLLGVVAAIRQRLHLYAELLPTIGANLRLCLDQFDTFCFSVSMNESASKHCRLIFVASIVKFEQVFLQNACSAHRVHDRLWNPQAGMDGGLLMAGAVKLVHQTSQEVDQAGAGSDALSNDDEDVRVAALMEYVDSWKHAGEHIKEAISNGAEVCLSQNDQPIYTLLELFALI